MRPIKIHNGGNYVHAQDSMLITSVRVEIQLNLSKTFIGQYLKGNSMGPIKICNGGNYAHAQDYNAYNLFEIKFS